MPKKRTYPLPGFGERLAQLRKRAGYTQVELAEELGTSQRMIAYYEGSAAPPTAMLSKIAQALNVSIDALLGTGPIKKQAKPKNTRLQRRLQEIEKLDAKQKRQILQLLDTFIERERFKKKAGLNT